MPSIPDTLQLQSALDRARNGEPTAFEDLVTMASERLFVLTRRMLRGYPRLRRWEQTDDVFQNAILRLHRSLAEVKPESVRQFFGLASTQIRRTLIDLIRHHFGPEGAAAHHETDAEYLRKQNGGVVKNQPTDTDGPASLASWADFHTAVGSLPSEPREVFELLWYGGLEQKQVAGVLGVSVPTVQRRWYAARHRLAQTFDHDRPGIERG